MSSTNDRLKIVMQNCFAIFSKRKKARIQARKNSFFALFHGVGTVLTVILTGTVDLFMPGSSILVFGLLNIIIQPAANLLAHRYWQSLQENLIEIPSLLNIESYYQDQLQSKIDVIEGSGLPREVKDKFEEEALRNYINMKDERQLRLQPLLVNKAVQSVQKLPKEPEFVNQISS